MPPAAQYLVLNPSYQIHHGPEPAAEAALNVLGYCLMVWFIETLTAGSTGEISGGLEGSFRQQLCGKFVGNPLLKFKKWPKTGDPGGTRTRHFRLERPTS